jgi:hypothetical protein
MAMPARNDDLPPGGNISMHAQKQRYHQASTLKWYRTFGLERTEQ